MRSVYEKDTEVRVGQENTLCDENKVVFNSNMPHSPLNGSNSLILERQKPPNPLFYDVKQDVLWSKGAGWQ